MCFYANDMEKKAQDLSFEEIKKLSESAGQFNRLWLSGGEPTMREDLPEIIEMFYKNNHIKDINFPSNGIKNERIIQWVKRLRQSCPEANISVSISFDGFGGTHDAQRGIASFYKAAECLKMLDDNFRDDGHVLKNAATVITKYNIEEILDFMTWVYGRFHLSTHTIEAARGATREDGVKILTEASLKNIQDRAASFYMRYADRVGEGMSGMAQKITKLFYVGIMRSMYELRADNIEKPVPWGMDCTAGETTLGLDYDGRFRACELREPVGRVQDYAYDVQKILASEAWKNEIKAIGHGYTANCWCTHGCWMMGSITFNPGKMLRKVFKGYRTTKKLAQQNPVSIDEQILAALETKYHLDREKLAEIGVIPVSAFKTQGAA
jgi:MoaA/NifB/PqqE/SkfB family radical SAM enzyme